MLDCPSSIPPAVISLALLFHPHRFDLRQYSKKQVVCAEINEGFLKGT